MNKKAKIIIGIIIAVVVLIAGAIGVWWMFLGGMTMSGTNSGASTTEPNTVVIQGFMFGPDTMTVPAGTTVTWVNKDFIGHDVKSDAFHSPKLGLGEKYSFTFTTPGTYSYICSIHPTMVGKIIVQ